MEMFNWDIPLIVECLIPISSSCVEKSGKMKKAYFHSLYKAVSVDVYQGSFVYQISDCVTDQNDEHSPCLHAQYVHLPYLYTFLTLLLLWKMVMHILCNIIHVCCLY